MTTKYINQQNMHVKRTGVCRKAAASIALGDAKRANSRQEIFFYFTWEPGRRDIVLTIETLH